MEQEIEDSTLEPQLDVRRRKMEKHGVRVSLIQLYFAIKFDRVEGFQFCFHF